MKKNVRKKTKQRTKAKPQAKRARKRKKAAVRRGKSARDERTLQERLWEYVNARGGQAVQKRAKRQQRDEEQDAGSGNFGSNVIGPMRIGR